MWCFIAFIWSQLLSRTMVEIGWWGNALFIVKAWLTAIFSIFLQHFHPFWMVIEGSFQPNFSHPISTITQLTIATLPLSSLLISAAQQSTFDNRHSTFFSLSTFPSFHYRFILSTLRLCDFSSSTLFFVIGASSLFCVFVSVLHLNFFLL